MGSSWNQYGNQTCVPCIGSQIPNPWTTKEVLWLIFYLFIFNWRLIALQYWFDFHHTSAWICHRCTYVSSLLNLPPTSHHSTLLQSPSLSSLSHTATSRWLSIVIQQCICFHAAISIHLIHSLCLIFKERLLGRYCALLSLPFHFPLSSHPNWLLSRPINCTSLVCLASKAILSFLAFNQVWENIFFFNKYCVAGVIICIIHNISHHLCINPGK